MRVLCLGVHVLDVLVRPVEAIPEGQGGTLVEQIRITAAGSAGGTALVLARLGAQVASAGAVGTDAAGDLLLDLLRREGIDVGGLQRRDDVQTSASVLPIRPTGERPAFHVVGANASWGEPPWDALAAADHVHLGGPEFWGGELAGQALAYAREHGATTSADLLAPGDPSVLEWIAPCLPQVDHLLPNDEQALGLTGAADLEAACAQLVDAGCGTVAVTRGGEGALVVGPGGATAVPAFDVEVVDTTGCGDAFSAGYVRGLGLGQAPADAARLGNAVAGIVAGGLGSDHGTYDLASVQRIAG
jgi:sugar/nucleoside kinase (ribokinase family)